MCVHTPIATAIPIAICFNKDKKLLRQKYLKTSIVSKNLNSGKFVFFCNKIGTKKIPHTPGALELKKINLSKL